MEKDTNLKTRMSLMEEQIKVIDEKLDKLDKKLDDGLKDIKKTYVRKDTYTIEKSIQSKRIDTINRLMWFAISAVLAFVLQQILSLVL
jgi:septal ring factor EnvC (AmiA/AmiB activator)